jgi:hypothetical protein
MNYLTQYYKNLSENLQNQINHLTHILNEAVLNRGVMEVDYDAMVDPPANAPSQTPPTETVPERGGPVPKDPGETPVRRPGESESDYQKRFEEYVRLKNAYKEYKKRCPTPCTGVWVYPNPKHPREQKGWKGGDRYIDGSGQQWYYTDGQWRKDTPAQTPQKPKGTDKFL